MEKQEFDSLLQAKTEEIDRIIGKFLPREEGWQKTLIQAMNYSVLAGGKRLRPMLMLETYRMLGGRGTEIQPFLAAIEMIHTYSLVHDDLPAMDNDEYRRGRETTWKVYGEAGAILAGDGLLNLAFETAAGAFALVDRGDPAALARVADALLLLAQKAGYQGMIGGQSVDVEAEGRKEPVTEAQLNYIHRCKTGALIVASMQVGGILAGADGETLRTLEQCAEDVGMAFQIRDDILDVSGDSRELGKPVGSDEENHKQTYVTFYGLEEAGRLVETLSEEAVNTYLRTMKGDHEFLDHLILMLAGRRK